MVKCKSRRAHNIINVIHSDPLVGRKGLPPNVVHNYNNAHMKTKKEVTERSL